MKAIEKKFGYLIKVLVLTKHHLQGIFKDNPFPERKYTDITKLHATLLLLKPDIAGVEQIERLITTNHDAFVIIDKTVYVHCPNGYGRTKFNNNFFEKKLKTDATTRNWKTISKLIELSNQ